MGIVTGAAAAYLIGCVPTARIVSGLVMRSTRASAWAPWFAGLADFAKGFLAVSLFAPVNSIGQALCLTAALAGDQWPIFGETGRPGHWTFLGGLSALTPVAAPLWAVCWALAFVATGFLSAGRVLAAAVLPPLVGFVAGWPIGGIALPGCIMLLERSRDLVARIRRGEEPRHHWNSES